MTVTFWIFLALVTAALAAATALRRRPAPRLPEADRLPGRDDLAGLGLSEVRAVSSARPVAAAAVATAVATPAARPAAAPPRATPVPAGERAPAGQEAARPEGPPSVGSGWIDDLLEDDEARPPDVEPGVEPPPEPSVSAPMSAEAPVGVSDEAVWTFDHSAAETAAPADGPVPSAPAGSASGPAYVRDGQTLWPEGAAPAALLAASLAARLGGSVAVVRHDGPSYVVELLAGPDGADARPEPMPADDHPLGRVPHGGDLTLFDDGDQHALTYHADAGASVGQVLAGTLAGPEHARVLLVADLPPGAPDVDEATAVLVGHYADLLADLSRPPAPVDDEPADAWDVPDGEDPDGTANDVEAEMTETGPEPDADAGDPDVADDEAGGAADDGTSEPAVERKAPAATVARPRGGRTEPVPPPRGVILSAEMAAARDARRPLVFALVTLADAEAVLRGGAGDVVRAEAALRQRLSAAPAVRRVEPFGDLLLGAFLDAEGPEVPAWAARLSSGGPPLLVGAVPASGSPDVVRATATAALQSAYEKEVVCVVAS